TEVAPQPEPLARVGLFRYPEPHAAIPVREILMRWSVVRLIWFREVRDLLRDRRTLFMMVGLPVLLYPAFGLIGFLFALSMLDQVAVVGVYGQENLPAATAQPTTTGPLPAQVAGWLAALPTPEAGPGSAAALAAVAGAVRVRQEHTDFPPL